MFAIAFSEILWTAQSFSLAGLTSFTKRLRNSDGSKSHSVVTMHSTLSDPKRPPQLVVGSPLPRVYVYDHCPFCVRVRFVLGVKNIKHNVIYLANDDVDTPTKLVLPLF